MASTPMRPEFLVAAKVLLAPLLGEVELLTMAATADFANGRCAATDLAEVVCCRHEIFALYEEIVAEIARQGAQA